MLGDLHLDQLEHHDREWLAREKPGDVQQVQNYSRITREVVPQLFAEAREQIAANGGRVAFTCHIGDFVEGLAGTPALARRHCEDAVALVRDAKLGRPFVFVKGNHDVTGPGAVEAFNDVLLPFAGRELKQKLTSASFTQRHGDAFFAYFDAYSPGSLDWLAATLAVPRKERHLFVVIHPPVVPYGARSTWHVFSKPREETQRARLLNLLGKHRAIVLCGHLHKYGTVVRQTPFGPFVQMAVISVLPAPSVTPSKEVAGVKEYGPELTRLEPDFSPSTLAERRNYLAAEAPHIRHYEYAEAPGYAVVKVGPAVTADLYVGLGKRLWRTVNLSDLLAG